MREPKKPATPRAEAAATPAATARTAEPAASTPATAAAEPEPATAKVAEAAEPTPASAAAAAKVRATEAPAAAAATAAPEEPAVAASAMDGDLMMRFATVLAALQKGGAMIGGLGVGGLRLLMPALAAYARSSKDDATVGADDPRIDATGRARFSQRENAALTAAAGKALLELIEITSRTDPIFAGATPYVAYNDGVFQPPHLMQILSLALAGNRLLGDDRDEAGKGDQGQGPVPIDTAHTVAYVALAPGEYARDPGPLTPTDIRRSAMRERTYNAPQMAMLARSANHYDTVPAAGHGGGTSTALMAGYSGPSYAQAYGAQSGATTAFNGAGQSHGACGCSSCSRAPVSICGCASCSGPAQHQFSPARRDADGKCASILSISCDTRWRLRECLKFSICDLIRCVGDEVCDDGQFAVHPDLKRCLEGFVCSLLTCLPEAICPPPAPITCCPAALPDDCNYASGR